MKSSRGQLLFGLEDRPPPATSVLAGLQHLMAIFGGIITAPLIIARGMNLSVEDTSYLITSALVVSGMATLLQVSRVGIVGSGLLSIQGTSFTFIGAVLFTFFGMPADMTTPERLGIIFGSAAVASLLMLPISLHINRLGHIFTPAVTGATVILLGMSLVWTTLNNLMTSFMAQETVPARAQVLILAALVFFITLAMSLSRNQWVRMTSIICGLGIGFVLALILGLINFEILSQLDSTFLPEPFKFGFGFDWAVLFTLFPIFIVSATESIGDLTATSAISRLPTSGPDYWKRVRGGLLADSINSFVASLLATFPNTTFSQNNGVIRITGIASRRIGYIIACLLIVLGVFPVIGGIFQLLPDAVLYGATLLMFLLVGLAGVNILQHNGSDPRCWSIAIAAVIGGWAISLSAAYLTILPEQIRMLLQFPVSTGAFLAIALEVLVPGTHRSEPATSSPS